MSYVENEEMPEKIRSGEVKIYIGLQEVTCHLIFDVNKDFLRKAWMFEDRAMTQALSSLTYYSIVSRDSVNLTFLIAELNDMNIMACKIVNAYLNTPCRDKIWFA